MINQWKQFFLMTVEKQSLGSLCTGVARRWNFSKRTGSWTHSSNKLSSGSHTLKRPSILNKHSLASLNESRQTGSNVRFLEWQRKTSSASFFEFLGCFLIASEAVLRRSSYLIISLRHLSKLTQKKISCSIPGISKTRLRSKSTSYPSFLKSLSEKLAKFAICFN